MSMSKTAFARNGYKFFYFFCGVQFNPHSAIVTIPLRTRVNAFI